MVKRIMIIGILALMMTGAAGWAEEASVLVQQARVAQRSISETLTVYGQVQADPDTVQVITMPHDGLIARVLARLGQRVTEGQTILEVAASPAAHMVYLKARAAVAYAEDELTRQQRLLKEKLTTNAQVAAAQNALQDARASLKALEAQGQNRAIMRVAAPASGIITQLDTKQGDRLQEGTALLEMVIGNHLVAVLGIEPEDIHCLAPGIPVTLRSVFVPDYQANSQLREIHAIINPATHLVDVLVPIPADQTAGLVLGSYLTADIRLSEHTGLTVPRHAVLQDEQGAYVFRIVDGRGKRTSVSTGQETAQWIEITSGLQKDEAIVAVGNYALTDGMKLREGR
jgi:RND family efflux transporter MFP subunit